MLNKDWGFQETNENQETKKTRNGTIHKYVIYSIRKKITPAASSDLRWKIVLNYSYKAFFFKNPFSLLHTYEGCSRSSSIGNGLAIRMIPAKLSDLNLMYFLKKKYVKIWICSMHHKIYSLIIMIYMLHGACTFFLFFFFRVCTHISLLKYVSFKLIKMHDIS